MIEVFNLDGMYVCKYRTSDKEALAVKDLEARGLPCGLYFVRITKSGGTRTAKMLVS